MDHALDKPVAAIGAFSVSFLSIYLGYRLFLAGATGEFKFKASLSGGSVGIKKRSAGTGVSLFGALLAGWAMYRLLPH
jgi:hypothetical protein